MQNVYYMHKTLQFNQNSYPPCKFLSQSGYLLIKTEVPINQHFIYNSTFLQNNHYPDNN